jgi:hypothetical protein
MREQKMRIKTRFRQNSGVVYQSVDSGNAHHVVIKDLIPSAKRLEKLTV